jgi:hypothetical protein
MIIGEAAGTTYALTGEGIGKAMESGMLAAELASAPADPLGDLGARYAAAMTERYAARFRTYETAHRWMRFPWVADLVARRANHNAWLHERLTGILTEARCPRTCSRRARSGGCSRTGRMGRACGVRKELPLKPQAPRPKPFYRIRTFTSNRRWFE